MNNIKQQIYDKIVEANKEYRNGTPIMSDLEYDTWIDKLREIDPDNDWFKHIEPVMNVSEDRKVKLPFPMRSLDKVKTIEDLRSWFKKVGLSPEDEIVIAPKYDGISLLCNEQGLMTYSRGGTENEGMDCKSHMRLMSSVFHQSSKDFEYTFGEAIITRCNWNEHFEGKINPLNGKPYKSARNTVSGIFRRDNPNVDLLKHVYFYRYGVFGDNVEDFKTYVQLIDHMRETCRYASETCLTTVSKIDECIMLDLFDSWNQVTAIDGLVLYVNDMSRWKSIGRNKSTDNPQWAIAYKPEAFTSAEITTVNYINCKVSKNGYLRPTIAIDAVELEGATIDNPTGNNAKFCFENGIGTGATIKVIRSGMVIPSIIGVIHPATKEIIESAFEYCPSCNKKTIWNESKTDRMCPDPNCKGRLLAKLVYFCDKMEYDDIGEETLKAVFDAGIRTPGELLHIDLSDLQKIDGIGYDTASKIIEKNKNIFDDGVSIQKLMEASDCFEGIGEKKAKLMLSNIDDETLQIWVNRELTTSGLLVMLRMMSITKGVGEKMINEFSKNERLFIEWIANNEIPVQWENEVIGDSLSGKKICFTGTRDRKLEAVIICAGGEVVSSVSKNTSFLIVGDLKFSSSKTDKAKLLDIPVVTIDQFKTIMSL